MLVDYLNPHWRLKIPFCLCKTYSMSCAICLNPLFFVGVFFFLIPFVLHVLYHFWFFKRCNSNNFFPIRTTTIKYGRYLKNPGNIDPTNPPKWLGKWSYPFILNWTLGLSKKKKIECLFFIKIHRSPCFFFFLIIFFYGVLHFIPYSHYRRFILSFDVNDEKFRETILPWNYLVWASLFEHKKLEVFKGSLA